MPVIVLTGIPCSGKSTRTKELRQFFEDQGEVVHVVSENDIIADAGIDKNDLFLDSSKEKHTRALVKAEANRLIGRKHVVILDAANYIKGYRYELYCISKLSKTSQCTVHCEIAEPEAWKRNELASHGYSLEVFSALAARFESPDGRSRWDAPLFTSLPGDRLPLEDIAAALSAQAPPPNKSTQNTPVQPSSFLYDLDRVTQDIVSSILRAGAGGGAGGGVPVPGTSVAFVGSATAPTLARLRRQFTAYATAHPGAGAQTSAAALFVRFLNTSLPPAP